MVASAMTFRHRDFLLVELECDDGSRGIGFSYIGNWAARSRDEEGRLLLESNPLRGLKAPSEKNPTRVMVTQAEYEALLRVADEVEWRFRVALVLAHETGHRIGAIRQLRWSGIDLDPGIWRNHLSLRDSAVEFPPFDSRQTRF